MNSIKQEKQKKTEHAGRLSKIWRRFRRWCSLLIMKAPGRLIMGVSAVSFLLMNAFIIQFEAWYNRTPLTDTSPKGFWNGLVSFWQIFNLTRWTATTTGHFGAMIVPGLLFGFTLFLLYKMRYHIFELDIEKKAETEAYPRRVIIMGLSVFNNFDASPAAEFAGLELDEAVSYKTNNGRPFQWQQNLRVLHHHFSEAMPPTPAYKHKLRRFLDKWLLLAWCPWPAIQRQDRHIFILPSHEGCKPIPDSAPPQRYVDCFIAMTDSIIENSGLPKPEFHIAEQSVDYNDLEELKNAFHNIIAEARTAPGIAARDDEISIDTTAGTKLQSIAAAAVTFASPVEFSYIEQSAPNKFVAFDVTAGFREM